MMLPQIQPPDDDKEGNADNKVKCLILNLKAAFVKNYLNLKVFFP